MASKRANRVRIAITTIGTGNFGAGAAVTGYADLEDGGLNDGDPITYVAEDASRTQWEVARGTVTNSRTEITRDEILMSSNANSIVDFLSTPELFVDLVKEDVDEIIDELKSHAVAMAAAFGS